MFQIEVKIIYKIMATILYVRTRKILLVLSKYLVVLEGHTWELRSVELSVDMIGTSTDQSVFL